MEEGECCKNLYNLYNDTCTNTQHTMIIGLNSWLIYSKSLLYMIVTLQELAVNTHNNS